MITTKKTSISIHKTIFEQAEVLAQHLNISRDHLFEIAIETFIRNPHNQALLDEINTVYQDDLNPNEQSGSPYQDTRTSTQNGGPLIINQGDIFWVQVDDPSGLELGIPHPHLVIQDNVFNHSRINTVVACALTSNMKRVDRPGNVLLEVSEANLPRQSIVEVSKVFTLDKTQLGEYIGSLSERRIKQVLVGMRFLQTSFFAR
jgi:mRNA interferase MazF